MKSDYSRYFYSLAEKVMMFIPDWITGKSEVMKQKYRVKYGKKDCSTLIYKKKQKVMISYLVILFLSLAFICYTVLENLLDRQEIKTLERPEAGQGAESIPVKAHIEYRNYELEKDVLIKVKQRELTDAEKKEVLHYFGQSLGTLILGENKDLKHIKKPLNLIDRDEKTGITIQWTSDQPEVIDEKGEVDLMAADQGTKIGLNAVLTLDDVIAKKSFFVAISPALKKEDYNRALIFHLNENIDKINENVRTKYVTLPTSLDDQIRIRWETGTQTKHGLMLFIFLSLFIIIYFKRYDEICKETKEAMESILIDLPDFINKLVLLLNAGLVVSSALIKIAEDYEQNRALAKTEGHKKKGRFLYEELCEIKKQVAQSNTMMVKELIEFGQRSGVRELIRLISIISDNWNKGSALAEKLEAEGELIWITRKKSAEEKAKLLKRN